MNQELKPCPFCGYPIRHTHGDAYVTKLSFFKCDKCGAVVSFDDPIANWGAMHGDDTPAFLLWNARAKA